MTNSNLILHDSTAEQLKKLIDKQPQAILITGQKGVGKQAVAEQLASVLMGIGLASLATNPSFKLIASDDGIEAVRGLRAFLSLKAHSNKKSGTGINRVAIIDASSGLSIESQNALLKLLEEPNQGSVIMVIAESDRSLLSTITSRTTSLHVHSPDSNYLIEGLVGMGYSKSLVESAVRVIGSLPGEILRVINSELSSEIEQAVNQAKQILAGTTTDRLAMIDGLSKQKQVALASVDLLINMSEAAIKQLSASDNITSHQRISKWQNVLEKSCVAKNRLVANSQTKLVLTDLMLSI